MMDFKANGIFSGILSKVLLTGVLISVWAVQAASLGKLTVSSYLGQPLNAEIALEAVTAKEADSLSARLASPKIFQKVGVNLTPYHATLSVSVERRTNGNPYIHVSSSQPINEPFLSLLIELSSSSGHLLREYNVLLDPADIQKTAPVAPVVVQPEDDKAGQFAAPVKRPPATQTAASTQAGNTYGPVAPGDTLSRIARQVSPDSVNLNQMLVALYRANRDAFLEKNMNLLKVGVILRIPDESDALSVTAREASSEIAVQKEGWDNYRQKIAALAGGSSERSGLKQSQTGKITTISEEAAGSGKPEEVLILSKGELINDDHLSAEKAENKTAQNYLHMMEEDAIAKERALQEANERVAILEQNVAKLQRLLELKESASENDTAAGSDHVQSVSDLQNIPGLGKQTGTATAKDSTEISNVTAAEALENPAAPMTIPARPIKPSSPLKSPQPVSDAPDEPDFVNSLLQLVDENSQWAAAGLGALLVIALGISLARRKKEQPEDFDSSDIYDDGGKPDELAASALTEIVSANMTDTEESGNESMMQQTTDASEPDNTDNRTDVDPGLFFAGKQDEKIIESLFGTADSAVQTYTENDAVSDELNVLDNEIDVSTVNPDQAEYQKEIFADIQEDTDHKEDDTKEQWIFTVQDDGLEEKPDFVQPQHDDEIHTSFHDTEHQIDFDLKLPEETEDGSKPHVKNELSELSSNLANIDLDLGDKSDTTLQAASEEVADMDMQRREVATKLDLARAYLEMEDSEGARDILEEVLHEGDPEQQSAARSMLDKIS